MKIFLLSLICLVSVVSAGVLDIFGQLGEDNLQSDERNVERIGAQRLTQLTRDDLVRQKFLLDILQNVNEPSVSKELQPFVTFVYDKLVDEQNLYTGGIDEQMSHVIELSGKQQLLGKQDVFTIANDEHMRQMIGIYRLLVRSRDWVTLQRNALHARIHVNGVLLVNSLLLAIQERDDTQNLIIPGIHEILPELYLDENLIRRAQDINLNQLINSRTNNMESQRTGILEMIGLNKLLNRRANGVESLDRRQFWMPWREMRMEIQARKSGRTNSPTRVTVRDDDRIVLPVTPTSNLLNQEEGEVRLLTADVGFQTFMHTFINDLCVQENEVKQRNREQKQWVNMEVNKSNLARVTLERNVGSMLESEIRRNDKQGESASDNTGQDDQIQVGQRQWIEGNRNDELLGNRFVNREQVRNGGRVNPRYDGASTNRRWQQRGSTINNNVAYQQNQCADNTADDSQVGGVSNRLLGVQLPTTTADDNRLLHVNRHRQNAVAANKVFLQAEQQNTGWNVNAGSNDRQANSRTLFMGTLNEARTDDVNNNPNNVNQRGLNPNMDFGTRMPMDWNRQMAMHRQRVNNPVEYNSRTDIRNPMGRVHNNENLQENKWNENLPQVDIDDERLLLVGRRQFNPEQQWQTKVDAARDSGVNKQVWKNDQFNENGVGTSNSWQTVSRGMGSNGVQAHPHFSRQSEIQSVEHERNRLNSNRRANIYWDNEPQAIVQDADSNIGINMWHPRIPRSLARDSVLNRKSNLERTSRGALLLHNLQQLVARINLEEISLVLNDKLPLEVTTNPSNLNNPRLTNAGAERLALRLNDEQLNTRRNVILLNRINEIEKRLQERIEQEINSNIATNQMGNVREQGSIDRLIGDLLIGGMGVPDQDVNILNVLRKIILQDEDIQGGIQKLTFTSMNAGDPTVLHLLRSIVSIADLQRQQQLGSYRSEEIQMSGVTINDVKVDKLRTYVDTSDIDLINILGGGQETNANRDIEQSQQMVVARQPRLNHKKFTINVDVTSDRDQPVVVRTLLGPKIDVTGGATQLNDQRQNFLLLDAHIADLRTGRNQIKRKSTDINWTTQDTTPFTEIYKRVLQALNSQVDAALDQLQGQNCRFPHRLLLPHGRVEGLPMQILVVITPAEDDARTMQELVMDRGVCGIGMGDVNVDRLPLGFPLDRPIDDQQDVLSLPNVQLVDVQIYHDNKLKVNSHMDDLDI